MNAAEKRKKTLYFIGITGGVYLAFQYLLPLIIPFLIAYVGASLLKPVISFLQKRLHLKRMAATVFVMLLFLSVLCFFGAWILGKLIEQASFLLAEFSGGRDAFYSRVYDVCCQMGENMGFSNDSIEYMVTGGIQQLTRIVEEKAMPAVMVKSVPALKWMIEAVAVTFIIIMSMLFICKDYELLMEKKNSFLYARELSMIGGKMASAGGAYIRTQLAIMILTTAICVVGLTIMKNPYALLLGCLIGVLDALPLIGCGLFFIPWIIIGFLLQGWSYALSLLAIYLLCYFVRELVEPKMMGKQVGISPLEMIISMYIGLKLFGLSGVLLGPVGYLLIIEIMRDLFPFAD